jgi:hypothetical protein
MREMERRSRSDQSLLFTRLPTCLPNQLPGRIVGRRILRRKNLTPTLCDPGAIGVFADETHHWHRLLPQRNPETLRAVLPQAIHSHFGHCEMNLTQ